MLLKILPIVISFVKCSWKTNRYSWRSGCKCSEDLNGKEAEEERKQQIEDGWKQLEEEMKKLEEDDKKNEKKMIENKGKIINNNKHNSKYFVYHFGKIFFK